MLATAFGRSKAPTPSPCLVHGDDDTMERYRDDGNDSSGHEPLLEDSCDAEKGSDRKPQRRWTFRIDPVDSFCKVWPDFDLDSLSAIVSDTWLIVIAGALIIFVIAAIVLSRSTTSDDIHEQPFFKQLYEAEFASPARFPMRLESAQPTDICMLCNCKAPVSFYMPNAQASKRFGFPPRPHTTDVRPTADQVDVNEFVRLTILDTYCARQHLNNEQALKLIGRTAKHLDEMMAWSLASLKPDRPTIYLHTATSPEGKSNPFRPQYIRRHGRAIRSWMSQQEARVLKPKTEFEPDVRDWQVVWLLAEDDVELDPLVLRTLQRTQIPFIYFAYGKTRAWGNAQKNALLQMVYALSRRERTGLYGHGPVYGLDDDNKIAPDLLNRITNIVRIGVFPVGHLGPNWEIAQVDESLGKAVGGQFDYGSFSYNSTLLGSSISGPMFWKHMDWAGEGPFLSQIGDVRSFELLCGANVEQDCHVVWHNEPLTDIERLTDEDELAYVRKNGAAKLFEALGFSPVKSDPV